MGLAEDEAPPAKALLIALAWDESRGDASRSRFSESICFCNAARSLAEPSEAGCDGAARAVLQQIRGPAANVEAELGRITASIRDEAAVSTAAPTLRSAMADPGLSRAIVLGASLQAFQQLSGINTV